MTWLIQNVHSAPSSNPEGCQIKCFQTKDCLAYSWLDGVCYLKADDKPVEAKQGVTSGIMCIKSKYAYFLWKK